MKLAVIGIPGIGLGISPISRYMFIDSVAQYQNLLLGRPQLNRQYGK